MIDKKQIILTAENLASHNFRLSERDEKQIKLTIEELAQHSFSLSD